MAAIWANRQPANLADLHKNLDESLNRHRGWNFQHLKGSLKEAIRKKESEIEILENKGIILSIDQWLKANNDLNDLLDEEEIYWKQRSRDDWLQQGNKNSKWFHHQVSERKT